MKCKISRCPSAGNIFHKLGNEICTCGNVTFHNLPGPTSRFPTRMPDPRYLFAGSDVSYGEEGSSREDAHMSVDFVRD